MAMAARIAYQQAKKTHREQIVKGANHSQMLDDCWAALGGAESKSLKSKTAPGEEEDAPILEYDWLRDAAAKGDSLLVERLAWTVTRRVVHQTWFNLAVVVVVVVTALLTGMSLSYADGEAPLVDKATAVVDQMAVVIFSVEVAIKMFANAERSFLYFQSSVNLFDFSVVALSVCLLLANLESLNVLRMLRLMRLSVLFSRFEALRLLTHGLATGIRAVGPIFGVILLVIYIYGMVGVLCFSENDPVHFGSVTESMLTLFELATLSGLMDIWYLNRYGCDRYAGAYGTAPDDEEPTFTTRFGTFHTWRCDKPSEQPMTANLFFSTFTILASLVIMALFIGVITTEMFDATQQQEHEVMIARRKINLSRTLGQLSGTDTDMSDMVSAALSIVTSDQVPEWARDDDSLKLLKRYLHLSSQARKLVNTAAFQKFVAATILMAAIAPGVESDAHLYGAKRASKAAAAGMNIAALIIFTFESLTKIVAEGLHPLLYFKSKWNCFDFLIVLVGYIEIMVSAVPNFDFYILRLVRMIRLARVSRLAREFPQLRAIAEALGAGFGAVSWMIVFLGISCYVTACIAVMLFRDNDPFHFGDISSAMLSMYRLVLLDGWELMMHTQMWGCERNPQVYPIEAADPSESFVCPPDSAGLGWFAAWYFMTLVMFNGLVLPTVLIGIICVSFDEVSENLIREAAEHKQIADMQKVWDKKLPEGFVDEQRLELMKDVFNALDAEDNGVLDMQELMPFLAWIMKKYFGITASREVVQQMMYEMDVDDSADVTFPEFTHALFMLKASGHGQQSTATNDEAAFTTHLSARGGGDEPPPSPGGPAPEQDMTKILSSMFSSPVPASSPEPTAESGSGNPPMSRKQMRAIFLVAPGAAGLAARQRRRSASPSQGAEEIEELKIKLTELEAFKAKVLRQQDEDRRSARASEGDLLHVPKRVIGFRRGGGQRSPRAESLTRPVSPRVGGEGPGGATTTPGRRAKNRPPTPT